MSIATDNTALKSEVVDAYNTHVQNVINLIAKNSSTGVTYTASAPVGSNGSVTSNLTNQSAVPSGQLDNTNPTKIAVGSLSTTAIASELYNLLISACNTMTKIRNCLYVWRHSNYQAGGDQEIQRFQYYTNLRNTTDAVSGSTRPYYTKDPNSQTTTADIASSVAHTGITQNNQMVAANVTTYLQALYNKWKSWTDSNVITYNYYTCHFNCHSNYDDRARR